MKNTFNILLISLSLLIFTFCSDDRETSETNSQNIEQIDAYSFVGRIEASNGFVDDSIEMNIGYVDTLSAYVFTFKQVSFSSKMPYIQRVQLRLSGYTIQGEDTIYESNTIIPYWKNAPIDFMILNNFHAVVTKDSLNFTSVGGATSSEGPSSITYKGVRK